jgi:hypothetical protein
MAKERSPGSFGAPSLRSGFRLQAPASLTPAKQLNFDYAPVIDDQNG